MRFLFTPLQPMGDHTDAVLGRLRPGGPGQLRVDRHQGVHQVEALLKKKLGITVYRREGSWL
jgi:hypothetical protein